MQRLAAWVLAIVAFGGMNAMGQHDVRAEESAAEWVQKATSLAAQGESAAAVEAATRAIEVAPDSADAYYLRGREHFRLGEVTKSVADFEKFVELRPQRAASLWELGISYYYAGQYEKGARQFELYQTYHDSDVENGVWRYLCMARSDGVEKAREKLLPIEGDPRVPMTEIYALYRGEATPEDVFAAAGRGDPPAEQQKARLFYAHLYVGLFHEAAGRDDQAAPQLEKAARDYRISHYMGDVARVHYERLRRKAGGE